MDSFWIQSVVIALTIITQVYSSHASQLECNPNSRAYSRLTKRISKIKSLCGDVCDTGITSSSTKSFPFQQITKDFDCKSLYNIPEGVSEFNVPLEEIPEFLKVYYSHNGKIPLTKVYMRDDFEEFSDVYWKKETIDMLRGAFQNDTLKGPYGYESVKNISDVLRNQTKIENARVLVIGSQSPWIEAMLLELKAREVVTLEYSEIRTTHPQIKPILPDDFNKQYLAGELEPFDLIVSFSSLEHSGLGRYGDPLNPWGDLITMAKVWCATKKGGRALIGVPTGIEDEIIFNAAKIYGPLQYSHLFANWKPVFSNSNPEIHYKSDCKWCYQPLYVIEK